MLSKVAGSVAMFAVASAAHAYNLPFPVGEFNLSDNSGENLIKGDGNTGESILEVGDILSGTFKIGDISGTEIGNTTYDELSGVFEIQVATKTPNGSNWDWTFDPVATFEDTYGDGAMFAFYQDPSPDYTREGPSLTLAQATESATNGNLFWVLGMSGSDTFWEASTKTDDTSAPTFSPGQNIGDYNLGLNMLVNNSGLTFTTVPCTAQLPTPTSGNVTMCGNGGIYTPAPGEGNITPFGVWDDLNFNFDRTVPEPASLALLSIGLMGLGGVARKRKAG
jgi:hypothetical protein